MKGNKTLLIVGILFMMLSTAVFLIGCPQPTLPIKGNLGEHKGLRIEGTLLKGYTDIPPMGILRVPKNITMIDSYAFRGCAEITSVDLRACTSLTKISFCAFEGCTNAEISLPASISTIDYDAFGHGAMRCKKVIVPNDSVRRLVSSCGYDGSVEVQP